MKFIKTRHRSVLDNVLVFRIAILKDALNNQGNVATRFTETVILTNMVEYCNKVRNQSINVQKYYIK